MASLRIKQFGSMCRMNSESVVPYRIPPSLKQPRTAVELDEFETCLCTSMNHATSGMRDHLPAAAHKFLELDLAPVEGVLVVDEARLHNRNAASFLATPT